LGDTGALTAAKNREDLMNFIERMFGISPDGGDGSTELMIISVLVLLAIMAVWRWWSKRSQDG
jgi:hypothetical protein